MITADPHSDLFVALADPSRRHILGLLRGAPRTVGDLVAHLPLSQPGVTRHLGVLERAGLIRRRAEGRQRICELDPAGFAALGDWLADYRGFWEGALDRIAQMAEEADHAVPDPDPDPDPADADHPHPPDRRQP